MDDRPEPHGRAGHEACFAIAGIRIPAPRAVPGLHIVATPIGHLGDITLRALATLAGVDAILCEDTRVTRTLLERYGIRVPAAPYHDHNADVVRPSILGRLQGGAALALVSDAGTPLIADPGYKLVREAAVLGMAVIPVPGASALTAALSVAGLPTDRFHFEGFLPPRREGRRRRLAELRGLDTTLVFFEAPQRLAEAVSDAAVILGDRPAAMARELTKMFETVRRGSLPDLAEALSGEAPPKGEIVLVVGPPAPEALRAEATKALDERLRIALQHHSVKDAVAVVAGAMDLPRKQVYARALDLTKVGGGEPEEA